MAFLNISDFITWAGRRFTNQDWDSNLQTTVNALNSAVTGKDIAVPTVETNELKGNSKSTDGTLAANSDVFVPSQKAVKTYVDSQAAPVYPDYKYLGDSSDGDFSSIEQNGTAQAGAAGTITLSISASSVDDYYNGFEIFILSGTGLGQHRTVIDYNGTTKIALVSPNWTVNPNATSVYRVTNAFFGGEKNFNNFTLNNNHYLYVADPGILKLRIANNGSLNGNIIAKEIISKDIARFSGIPSIAKAGTANPVSDYRFGASGVCAGSGGGGASGGARDGFTSGEGGSGGHSSVETIPAVIGGAGGAAKASEARGNDGQNGSSVTDEFKEYAINQGIVCYGAQGGGGSAGTNVAPPTAATDGTRGGYGGGGVWIYANNLTIATSFIDVSGENGPFVTGAGWSGGGGGGGGGGGSFFIAYINLIGSFVDLTYDISGGTGALGGTGVSPTSGGDGGDGGAGWFQTKAIV